MKQQQKMVPELRFIEFDEKWDEDQLGNLFNISSGGTPNRSNPAYWNGSIPWITTSLVDFNIVSDSEEYITEDALKNSSAKLFPQGTILMAMYGQGKTRGKVCMLGIEATTNQACAAIIPNDRFNTCFIFQNLSMRYDKIRILANDGGQQNLSAGLIKNLPLIYPSLPEQTKIANFLTAVDRRIELLDRKKKALEQYKKGVMQQLFPSAAGQAPQIRFKDDNGQDFPDWEEKRAKMVFGNHTNKKHEGDLPILSASQEHGMIYRDDSGIKIQSSEKSVKSYKIVEPGDFVISLRSFQGGLDYSSIRGICSPAYTVLRNYIPVDAMFFKYYFKKEEFINRLSQTTIGIRDGKQITYEAFGALRLPYPSIPEQQKISSFLSAIDKKIQQVGQQLEHNRQWKKGLLQKMFV